MFILNKYLPPSLRGGAWETDIEPDAKCSVNDLLVELYDKAGHAKQWWLVRHIAGMLHKQVGQRVKRLGQ